MISLGYNHHMVTLYLNGNPPWLKVFGDDQKPRVVVVTVLTSLILLLYDGLMVSHVIAPKMFFAVKYPHFLSYVADINFALPTSILRYQYLFQATFGAYVYSYAVRGAVHIQPSHAAYLNSLFWVSMFGMQCCLIKGTIPNHVTQHLQIL